MNRIETAFSSARFNRIMLALGVLVFAAGAVTLVIELVPSTNGESPASTKLTPSKATPQGNGSSLTNSQGARILTYEQLDPKIRATVRTFLDSAVARHNQGRAWSITTANLRSGYTRKQWNTADALPVVPYPIADIKRVNYNLEYATTKEILIDVGVAAKPQMKLRALTFMLGLAPAGKGAHKRWLVDYWMPRYTPPIPIS
jgi:hypothetical protein